MGRRHHVDDTGMALRCFHIEKRHATTRNAARRDDCVEHFRVIVVGGVACGARDLEDAVAAGQRLTDIRAVTDMRGRLDERDLRHG